MQHKTYFKTSIVCALFVIGLTLPLAAWAATVFLNPAIEEHSLGDTFTTQVRIDTEGEVINTVETHLVFSQDVLEVVSLEKENSILSLWIGDPAYLNAEGFISFIGGLPTPGYQGKDGLIGTITFKVKGEGKAGVSFEESSSRVLLNDGFGTEALLKTKGAVYTLYTLSSIKKKLSAYAILPVILIFLLGLAIWKGLSFARKIKHA